MPTRKMSRTATPTPTIPPIPPDAVWLTVPQAAHILQMGERSAWERIKDGTIPSRRIGRLVRVPREAVMPTTDTQ